MAQALRVDRKTLTKYRDWAQAQGFLDGELPDLATLHARRAATWGAAPPQNRSSAQDYRDEIARLLEQGLGPRLIYLKLAERPEFTCSESAIWRLTKKLRRPKDPEVVGRVETPPGEAGQVDFGEVTPLVDPASGELRRTWPSAWCWAGADICTSSSSSTRSSRPGWPATSTPSSSSGACLSGW